ncbi:MAG: TetR/AcrR family transcriptional regulator [Aquabacterium sp.]|uniref:TetR/AcrR family transcriptional regulator n=1 Tax=Aquabacterium sp. TaxID=1872578 RepID=UPI003BAF4BC1
MDELREHGIGAFSVPRVAKRAGVHTATIYRRWETQAALIAFAGGRMATGLMPPQDTGSLEGDLRAMLRNLRTFLESEGGAALVAIAFASGNAPEIAELKRIYWAARAEKRTPMFKRACLRGEMDDQADFEELIEMAIGPLYVRRYISNRPIDDALIDRVVAQVLPQPPGLRHTKAVPHQPG